MSEEMDTLQLYAYVQKGIAGAPDFLHGVQITGEDGEPPKPIPDRTAGGLAAAGYSYWAISGPECLLHVYFEGPLPDDELREAFNRDLYRYALAAICHWEQEDGK